MHTLLALSGICIAGSLSVSQIPAEIGVSVIMCIIFAMFHWLQGETFYRSPKSVDRFLPSPFFCSRLIYLQLHSPALTLPTPGGCSGVWSVHGSIFKWLFQITSKQIDCVLAFVIVCMISIVYALCCSNVFCQVFNREAVGGFSCVNLDTIAEHLTLHDPPHIKFNKDGLLCWNHK